MTMENMNMSNEEAGQVISTHGEGNIEHERSNGHASSTGSETSVDTGLVERYEPVRAFVSMVRRTKRTNM
jgi:hypothetical protein